MKKIQAIVTAFGFQPELEKPLILEMSHLFVKGYEKKKKTTILVSTRMLLSY